MADEKKIQCYKCKKSGHYRSQCPLLLKNNEINAFSVAFLSGTYTKTEWYVDSGASAHMTVNKHWIKNANFSPSLSEITIANNTTIPVVCSGNVEITTNYNYKITIKLNN